MVMLVELAQVKARLRFDHEEEDADIEFAIKSASAAVMNYLKLDHDFYTDSFNSSGEVSTNVPEEVAQAVITLVGIWKRDPAGAEMRDWEMGYLPRPVMAILYPLRDPAMQ
jgi:hypothetical protein